MAHITIFNRQIPVQAKLMPIEKLDFFEENPRVYSAIAGEKKPDNSDDLQDLIYKKMKEQQSVKKLIPTIKKHGGLIEPILVRHDTRQVIEGNSRLAAFRQLYDEKPDEKWAKIPCNYVTRLTPEEQDAYLAHMHMSGKTAWTPYGKANACYVRHKEKGIEIEEIAKRFSTTPLEVRKCIDVIEMMKRNRDKDEARFNHYNTLVRSRKINFQSVAPKVKKFILKEIKEDSFHALELRDQLPDVLAKTDVTEKFVIREMTLEEAYLTARPSQPEKKVKAARDQLDSIERADVSSLDSPKVKALFADTGKLVKSAERVHNMVKKAKEKNA